MLGIDNKMVREFAEEASSASMEIAAYFESMKLFIDRENDSLMAIDSAYKAFDKIDEIYDLAEKYGIITADYEDEENEIE